MDLTLESGDVIRGVTDRDICSRIEGEEFAILAADDGTYLQCAEQRAIPYEYILEYQEGDPSKHYQATDDAVPVDRVIATFLKYLRGDESWKSDFTWQRIEL
jgi:GGDEF domain-containing protein